MRQPQESHRRTIAKPSENHMKTIGETSPRGESLENNRKPTGMSQEYAKLAIRVLCWDNLLRASTTQAHNFCCRFFVESEPCVLTHFKRRGAFPSSRLDSHQNFEPFRLGYVDFCKFSTYFVPILMFSTRN